MPPPDDREEASTPEIRVRELEAQLDKLSTERAALGADLRTVRSEISALGAVNEKLVAERDGLRQRLDSVAGATTALPLDEVGARLKQALVSLGKVTVDEAAPLDYVARSVQFDLRAQLGLDDKGKPVMRFPGVGERFAAHELTGVHLAFDAVPRAGVDIGALQAVPNVVGLTTEAAEARLVAAGFVAGKRVDRESVASPGTVVDQDPPHGSYGESGLAVDLALAVPARVVVPDLVGRPAVEAEVALREVGLAFGEAATDPREDPAPGIVVAQVPAAGQRTRAGEAVSVTVAAAPERVEVPGVVGLSLADAVEAIVAAGLTRGTVGRQRSDKTTSLVVRQNPVSGARVAPGSAVDLTVSQPAIDRSVAAPDLVARPRDEAVARLRDAGWGVRVSVARDADPFALRSAGRFGLVLAQDPVAGQPVPTSRKLIELLVAGSPAAVSTVKGIGSAGAQQLGAGGIDSVGALANTAPDEVAEILGVGSQRAAELVEAARSLDATFGLQGVDGVNDEVADALLRAGVRSAADLAAADPAVLGRRLRESTGGAAPGPNAPRFTPTLLARLVRNAGEMLAG